MASGSKTAEGEPLDLGFQRGSMYLIRGKNPDEKINAVLKTEHETRVKYHAEQKEYYDEVLTAKGMSAQSLPLKSKIEYDYSARESSKVFSPPKFQESFDFKVAGASIHVRVD